MVGDYVDEASGKTVGRPGLVQAFEDGAAGAFDVLAFTQLDRLSRNLRDTIDLFQRAEEHDLSLASIKETLDTSTPVGRMVIHMLAAFAQFEREQIQDRVLAGIQSRLDSGLWMGSLPIGMKTDGNGLPVADFDYLPLAVRIFRMYVEERGRDIPRSPGS